MDIYQNLKKDHVEVKKLLTELLSLNENDEYRHTIIEKIASELIPHARAEEAVVYNSIRAADADTGVVMHSYKEHMEAEGFLRLLQTKDKLAGNWKETAQKLKDSLEHHIQEEETKIFAQAKKLFSDEEAYQISSAFDQLKAEYKKQGVIKNSMDLVINLMPARLANKINGLDTNP